VIAKHRARPTRGSRLSVLRSCYLIGNRRQPCRSAAAPRNRVDFRRPLPGSRRTR
jgi:hypothetical protein